MRRPDSRASGDRKIIDHYHDAVDTLGLFAAHRDATAAGGLATYRVQPHAGQGWMDMCEFTNGMLLSRMHIHLHTATDNHYGTSPADPLNIGILLRGHTRTHGATRQAYDMHEGDVFVRHGEAGNLRQSVPADCPVSGVSISIPRALADSLQLSHSPWSSGTRHTAANGALALLRPSAQTAARLRRLGQRIVALQADATFLGRLALESASLDLLLALLREQQSGEKRYGRRRWQAALDDALSIVHAEWAEPLTIAGLARRVGINECYLKTLFREHTGETIADYLRRLRMQHAREMIEGSPCTIQEVALRVGYANPGKFASAFRRIHGRLPSELR